MFPCKAFTLWVLCSTATHLGIVVALSRVAHKQLMVYDEVVR